LKFEKYYYLQFKQRCSFKFKWIYLSLHYEITASYLIHFQFITLLLRNTYSKYSFSTVNCEMLTPDVKHFLVLLIFRMFLMFQKILMSYRSVNKMRHVLSYLFRRINMITNQNSIQKNMCFMIQGKCEDTLVYTDGYRSLAHSRKKKS
jgi:hypothetical protein